MAHVIQRDNGEVELVLTASEEEVPVRTDILQGLVDEHNALTRVMNSHTGCSPQSCTTMAAIGVPLYTQWLKTQ